MTKPFYLSASRIDTFTTCSALYAAKYLARLPDAGNDGSNRGSVAHVVLECLLKPRHQKRYLAAIKAKTCMRDPALSRLIMRLAKRHGVHDVENVEMIDGFVMVALRHQFHGPPGTKEAMGEREFELRIDNGTVRYNVRGAIDKTFRVEDSEGQRLETLDYKSSKAKFSDEKETDNVQSQMYQLALRHLYPDIKRRSFAFLFLKFPRAPVQEQPSFTDEHLDAFEWRLHYLQQAMEAFTMEDALSHPAALDADKRWLCGREGTKKDGSPCWMCSARRPLDYWVTINTATGHIEESAFTREALPPVNEGEHIEERSYKGCPFYYNARGQPIQSQ